MLMRLLNTESAAGEKTLSIIDSAKEYMVNNYQRELTVSDKAKAVNLSPSYFLVLS